MTFFLDFVFIIVFFFLTLVKGHLTKGWFIFSEDWCLKLSNLIQYSLHIIGVNLAINDIP